MNPIVGHQRQIQYLERVLGRGTLAHAYLFHGPEGVGKRTLAMAVAQALLCSGQRQSVLGGCGSPSQILPGKIWAGRCEDCRLVSRSLHPDLITLSFEQPLVASKNEREISIENIHELQRRLSLSAWRGGRKVAMVDQAEAMSRDAQSSLLKILEEPDAKTVFFLIAPSPDAILPTVRSRCVLVRFAALGDAELAPLAVEASGRERPELLALAEGRPGALVRLTQDPSFLAERRAAANLHARLGGMDLAGRFAFSDEQARDAGAVESAISYLLRAFRADLHAALAGPSFAPQNLGGPADAQGHGGRIPSLAAALALLLERLRILETTTANRRLVADSAFFELSPIGAEQP